MKIQIKRGVILTAVCVGSFLSAYFAADKEPSDLKAVSPVEILASNPKGFKPESGSAAGGSLFGDSPVEPSSKLHIEPGYRAYANGRQSSPALRPPTPSSSNVYHELSERLANSENLYSAEELIQIRKESLEAYLVVAQGPLSEEVGSFSSDDSDSPEGRQLNSVYHLAQTADFAQLLQFVGGADEDSSRKRLEALAKTYYPEYIENLQ